MVHILALFMILAASASEQDVFDKTYPRDNTYCQIGGKKLEIMIRGFQSHIEPKERMWGENVFTRVSEGRPSRLPVTQESGLYRFFQGNPSSCTKAVGTKIGKRFAVLFQKLNSPHKHQVVIQYLDPQTLKALETIHTPYLSDKTQVTKNGFIMRTHSPFRQKIEMGKVMIAGNKYLYQDHEFPIWVSLDKAGFSQEAEVTYENFSYKSFFKNADEFKLRSGWQEQVKTFTRAKLYVAINHQTKSKCILLLESKTALTGEENWICQ